MKIMLTDHNDNVTPPPPWEVLDLLSHHLDPKTLAISSCVSKTWLTCFSSDHLWDPLCSSHFPSLSTLTTATVPRCRLYGLGHAASRLRHRKPRHPKLSLDTLLFTLTIRMPNSRAPNNGHVINIVKPCKDLARDPHGLFRFDVELEGDSDRAWCVDELDGLRVTWNVVDSEWKAVFTMAEESGKGSFVSGMDGWFSEELPSAGCCSSTRSSGLVADLRLGMRTVEGLVVEQELQHNRDCQSARCKSKVKIEKVGLGVMCVLNWTYVSLEDVLYYLEHFLEI